MVTQIFKALVLTSAIGSLLAMLLILIKPLTKKYFSGSWNYYCWITVLIVMILPVKITLPTNIPEAIPAIHETVLTEDIQTAILSPNPTVTVHHNETLWINAMDIISYLWLVGVIFILCIKLLTYGMLLWEIRKHTRIISCPELSTFTAKKITVRVGNTFHSPLMIGIWKPTLLLPDMEMTPEQRNNMLHHEITHFKRHDVWYKWFAMIVKCVHWFNPVIYYVTKQINLECEISCDLAVVSNMNKEEEISYLNTILTIVSHGKTKNVFFTTGMATNKEQIKRRFIMIKNRTKVSKITRILSVMLITVLLSISIFTSGILAATTGLYDNHNIQVSKFGQAIPFINKPYVENGTLYLPLRETLSHFIDLSDNVSTVSWEEENKEEILLFLFDKEHTRVRENGDTVYTYLYYYKFKLGMPYLYGADKMTDALKNAPVLRNNITYVPVESLEMIKAESGLLAGFDIRY